jgi:hypothetical protein
VTATATRDPATLRTTLLAWAAFVSGRPAGAVVYDGESNAMVDGLAISIDEISSRNVGGEVTAREYDPSADHIVRKVLGLQHETLSITFDGYDQRLSQSPMEAARRFVAVARSTEARAMLRAAGAPMTAISGPTSTPRVEAGRSYPRAVVEVRLTFARVDDLAPVEVANTATITGSVRDPLGAELVPPLSPVTEVDLP